MNYNEKLKELTEKFILEMESLKSKNQLLKIEKEKDSARYEETFKLSEDKHNQVLFRDLNYGSWKLVWCHQIDCSSRGEL